MKIRNALQPSGLLITVLVSAVFAVFILAEADLPVLGSLERKSRDLRFILRGEAAPSGEVIVVAVDDHSIDVLGRWPWRRSVLADLILRINAGGAKAVGVDLLLSEPQGTPELRKIESLISLYRRFGLLTDDVRSQVFFEEMAEAARAEDEDRLLASVIREGGDVILATALIRAVDPEIEGTSSSIPGIEKGARPSGGLLPGGLLTEAFAERLMPIPALADTAWDHGFVNVVPDGDGAVRKGLAVACQGGRPWFPLSIMTARKYLGLRRESLSFDGNGTLRLGDRTVPLDERGRFFINDYGPSGTIPLYSAIDVLRGAVPAATFQDKCVLIGGAAVGLGDHWPNPYTEFLWGVESHATMVDNLLTGRFLRRPDPMKYGEAAAVFLVSLLTGLLFMRVSVPWFLPAVLGVLVVYAGLVQYLFAQHRLIALWVYPFLALTSVAIGVFMVRYLTEVKEKRMLRGAFDQYLNPSVVRRILQQPEDLALGGRKKELTVLFSDIRGFTAISEHLEPEVLVLFMNRYLTAMTDILMDHEGTLDKYIGDAVMGIFGAPESQEDHAVRACRTALEMSGRLKDLRREWIAENLPPIRIGIGINTGPMVVGNIGSEKRFVYSVMGDHVNLASRLESLTKTYGVEILVSQFTREAVADRFILRRIDRVRVKGKQRAVSVFQLIGDRGPADPLPPYVSRYEEGLRFYFDGEWDDAERRFTQALEFEPEDRPSRLLLDRCRTLRKNGVDPSWDGVHCAETK